MARMDRDFLSDKHLQFPVGQRIGPLGVSDFITSSSVTKKYPLNYPYNIYNSAWEAPFSAGNGGARNRFKSLWWWQPEQDSIPAQFLESSSMHGLKYVSQPKRHIIERIFWLASFIACVTGAVLMILEIWNRYYLNPVIVTFNPAELDLDSIPFPAITICNTNPFKKSTVEDFVKAYREGRAEADKLKALDALRVINGICLTQESFLQTLKYAATRGQMLPEAEANPSLEMEKNLTQFLLDNSQPCRELLRFCVWGQKQIECEKLFKPIITDYGKCCTFNMLPQELMESYHSVTQSTYGQSPTMKRYEWTKKEIEEWRRWDYDTDGYILPVDLKYPYRQRRAGTVDGLSLLIDADVENNFCPSTDSEGIKILCHVSLDAPRVADLGSVVGVNREVYLEVNPDITIADPSIESFDQETRKCYFGFEYKLNFYKPYTRSNCMEECWTNILIENCSCVLYYAPRNSSTNVCSTTPGTNDYNCVKENEQRYLGRLHRICSHCKYSCNDLTYNAEITYAQLQSKDILWTLPNGTKYDWMDHKLTVIHIFMGADSTVPKLRAKLYQAVDLIGKGDVFLANLISNTGGLLGLSIGFSVLSFVEIIYFATMRICCKHLRKSKNFGEESGKHASPNNDHGEVRQTNFVATTHPSTQKTTFNRLSLLDNSNFLHEVNSRNLMARS